MFMMPDGSALWIHNQDWSVGMADMKPTWDSKRLSDYGGTPTTVTYMSLGPVDPADYTDFIPEWRPGMSFPPEDMVDQWIDPSRLGGAHNEFTKQYETGFWPGLSLRPDPRQIRRWQTRLRRRVGRRRVRVSPPRSRLALRSPHRPGTQCSES